MVGLGTIILAQAAISGDLWVWAGITLFMTAVLGFAAGVCYARMSVKWAFRRAQTHLSNLYVMVLNTLETAQEACSLLEKFPNLLLTPEQTEQLDAKQTRLLDTVANIIVGQKELAQPAVVDEGPKFQLEDFTVEWTRSPEDFSAGVPDRTAFDASLCSLLELVSQTEVDSALLLIRVDKLDHLKVRFGTKGTDQFMRKMASVICLAIRDKDLVCRFSGDTFAVLMPGVQKENGVKLAQAIRDTVRNHHFRLEESGPEVLVTASFGHTPLHPEDNADLVLNRAGNALSKSQRRGRNQLHVFDGDILVHCIAG